MSDAQDRAGHALAERNLKPSPIAVHLAIHQSSRADGGRIYVDVDFRNTSSAPQRLEKWLALEPPEVNGALLLIRRSDGTQIKYTGRHVHRNGPRKQDYVTFRPGETRVVKDVDVTDAFGWPRTPETITVAYWAMSFDRELTLLRSPAMDLRYVPVDK